MITNFPAPNCQKGVYIIYKTAENFPEMARTGRKVSKAMKKL